MKIWKEFDKNANERDVKVIVSDNILNHPDTRIYEHAGDLLNKFQVILPSSGIYFGDENDTKLFSVVIDGTRIGTPVDQVIFLTGQDDEYEIATSTISGSVESGLDCSDIIFEKGLKDAVYIDIETIDDNYIILNINTCNNLNELLQ